MRELYEEWKSWCEANGRDHPGTANSFGRQLRAYCPRVGTAWVGPKGKQSKAYRGIGVTEAWEGSSNDGLLPWEGGRTTDSSTGNTDSGIDASPYAATNSGFGTTGTTVFSNCTPREEENGNQEAIESRNRKNGSSGSTGSTVAASPRFEEGEL